MPFAHKVVEIGTDYVVVRDVAGVKETMIPVYAVKGVEKVKTKQKSDVSSMDHTGADHKHE